MNNLPDGRSFKFAVYDGSDDKDRLVSDIISSALQDSGTELVTHRATKHGDRNESTLVTYYLLFSVSSSQEILLII